MRGLVGVGAAAAAIGVRLGVSDMGEFSSKSTMTSLGDHPDSSHPSRLESARIESTCSLINNQHPHPPRPSRPAQPVPRIGTA